MSSDPESAEPEVGEWIRQRVRRRHAWQTDQRERMVRSVLAWVISLLLHLMFAFGVLFAPVDRPEPPAEHDQALLVQLLPPPPPAGGKRGSGTPRRHGPHRGTGSRVASGHSSERIGGSSHQAATAAAHPGRPEPHRTSAVAGQPTAAADRMRMLPMATAAIQLPRPARLPTAAPQPISVAPVALHAVVAAPVIQPERPPRAEGNQPMPSPQVAVAPVVPAATPVAVAPAKLKLQLPATPMVTAAAPVMAPVTPASAVASAPEQTGMASTPPAVTVTLARASVQLSSPRTESPVVAVQVAAPEPLPTPVPTELPALPAHPSGVSADLTLPQDQPAAPADPGVAMPAIAIAPVPAVEPAATTSPAAPADSASRTMGQKAPAENTGSRAGASAAAASGASGTTSAGAEQDDGLTPSAADAMSTGHSGAAAAAQSGQGREAGGGDLHGQAGGVAGGQPGGQLGGQLGGQGKTMPSPSAPPGAPGHYISLRTPASTDVSVSRSVSIEYHRTRFDKDWVPDNENALDTLSRRIEEKLESHHKLHLPGGVSFHCDTGAPSGSATQGLGALLPFGCHGEAPPPASARDGDARLNQAPARALGGPATATSAPALPSPVVAPIDSTAMCATARIAGGPLPPGCPSREVHRPVPASSTSWAPALDQFH
ncbi:hypothetical protein ACYJW8_05365 [Frateuria aurantia]